MEHQESKLKIKSTSATAATAVATTGVAAATTTLGDASKENTATTTTDIDGLRAFSLQFRHALVLFVIPDNTTESNDPLDRPDSFVNQAMQVVRDSHGGNARCLVVSNTDEAIATIRLVADYLTKTTASKKHFFERKFEPFPHAVKTMRQWGDDSRRMQPGEASLLVRSFVDLQSITMADWRALQTVPVDETTKEWLVQFFHANIQTNEEGFARENVTAGAMTLEDFVGQAFLDPSNEMAQSSLLEPVHFGDAPVLEMDAASIPQTFVVQTQKQWPQEHAYSMTQQSGITSQPQSIFHPQHPGSHYPPSAAQYVQSAQYSNAGTPFTAGHTRVNNVGLGQHSMNG
jgi:hypothetical protein